MVKNLLANAGDTRDMGSVPALGRSSGGGNDNSLQHSCMENSMDRGAWGATVRGWGGAGHKDSDMTEQLTIYTHTV